MGVQVMGVQGREMPGLKKSLREHAVESAKTGDALLNVTDGARGVKNAAGEPLGENDPRPTYSYQPFPKMVFHKTLGERVVEAVKDLEEAEAEGFRLDPYPVIRVAVADPGVEKAELKRQLLEKDGQLATLADQMQNMQSQMSELMAAMKPAAAVKTKVA